MYHTYRQPYSVLPQLRKLKTPIFDTSSDKDYFLKCKLQSTKQHKCFVENKMTQEIYETICGFITENYPVALQEPFTFENLAMQIQEDLVIQRKDGDEDWMAAGHICFPSGWSPEEKIGKPLREIHAPIPDMDLKNSYKLVDTMINFGPFERFVWSVIYENRLNFHPNLPKQPFNGQIYIKVERQITCGFPEHNAALFVLRQYIIPEHEIDKVALVNTLSNMTPEQWEYKGITEDLIELLGDNRAI